MTEVLKVLFIREKITRPLDELIDMVSDAADALHDRALFKIRPINYLSIFNYDIVDLLF